MLACAYQKEHFDALSLSSLQEWSNAEPIHALPFSFSRAWNNEEHFDALSLSSIQEWSHAELFHALPSSFSRAWNNEDSCFPGVHQSSPRKKLT